MPSEFFALDALRRSPADRDTAVAAGHDRGGLKRRDPQSMQQVLAEALTAVARRTGSASALKPFWHEVVGAGLARQSEPVFLEGTRLQINVSAAAWGQALAAQEGEILARLAAHLGPGAVTALSFRVAGT
jgi:hypothetical protein